jgi:hypothetical protein
MPKRLLARWQPESIREFQAAAHQRFDDRLALANQGHRTAAIYLWGYSGEMILKAAYFRFLGLAERDIITWGGHLQPAMDKGRNVLGIAWPIQGQGHNVQAWAELLVAEHAAMPGRAYLHPLGLEIQHCGQSIGQLWRETLRYHKNLAYLYEMNQVREAVEWLLANSNFL